MITTRCALGSVVPVCCLLANVVAAAPDGASSQADAGITADVLAEVVVTGSNLRTTEDGGPSPVAVFSRAELDELGVSTVTDVLRYVPQQPYLNAEMRNSGGAQFAEMRGLGVDTTLVLINGRRTIASAANATRNAFDLNTIPLAAVERIEILSDSASAVYGADAVGGVMNVILKKEIPAPVLDLSYGSAAGGADERRISMSGGYTNERLRASLILDYFDRGALLGQERDRYANQDFRRFGGIDWRSATTNPGNVSSLTPDPLPGLPSRFAAVPHGSTGVGLTPGDFLATAGAKNLDSLYRYQSIVGEAERRSAIAFAEFDITSKLTTFGEFMYTDRRSRTQRQPSALYYSVVPASNPYNPFGVPVAVDYLLTGLGPEKSKLESDLLRGVVGLRGGLGSWEWEVSLLRTRETGSSSVANVADMARVAAALAETDPDRALNPFQDGPGGSEALLRSLVAERADSFSSNGTQLTGLLRGTLWQLPSGSVDVVVGAEARTEDLFFKLKSSVLESALVDHDRNTSAIFMEARIPLVSADSKLSLMRELSLTVAARNDHYDDFGSSFNPQFGLVWKPAADLTLRTSYGTAFRPPSLTELYGPRATVSSTVSDPRRGGEAMAADLVVGGNPDLQPIEAESFTTGLVFSPAAWDGFKMTLNYWRIRLSKRVATFDANLVLVNEDRFPERVTRAQPSPADQAAGLPGGVTVVDTSAINFGSLKTSGIDLAFQYAFETGIGRFSPSLAVTWVDSFRSIDVPDTPEYERVGIADPAGSIAKWQAVAGLGWAIPRMGLSAVARYLPAYDDALYMIGPTGRSIASFTQVDLQGWYSFDSASAPAMSWLQGLKLTVGLINVFDREPSFAEVGYFTGHDLSQGDLRQRFAYLRLSKSF